MAPRDRSPAFASRKFQRPRQIGEQVTFRSPQFSACGGHDRRLVESRSGRKNKANFRPSAMRAATRKASATTP